MGTLLLLVLLSTVVVPVRASGRFRRDGRDGSALDAGPTPEVVDVSATEAGGPTAEAVDVPSGPDRPATSSTNTTNTITNCTRITSPGVYELGSNVTTTSNSTSSRHYCLGIEVGNVTIDGNGHTLQAGVSDPDKGVLVQSNPPFPQSATTIENVTIENLTVANWTDSSVVFRKVNDVTVTETTVRNGSGNGLVLKHSNDSTITDVTVENQLDGIEFVGVTHSRITQSTLEDNRGHAITLHDGNSPDRNRYDVIENNSIRTNDGRGVELSGKSNETTVTDNVVFGNKKGVWVSGPCNVTISDNEISASTQDGVRVTSFWGYGTLANVTVANNTVRQNGDNGVVMYGYTDSSVVGNTLTSDGQSGVLVRESHDTVVRNNTATKHFGGFDAGVYVINDVNGTRVVDNRLENNHDGVRLATTDNVTVEQNELVNNTKAGVRATGRTVLEDAVVRNNTIAGNDAYGIKSENSSTSASLIAVDNWWGNASGPSSATSGNLTDPVTGAVANGSGDAVSENPSVSGQSNVHFDPWLNQTPTTHEPFEITTKQLAVSSIGTFVSHRITTQGGVSPATSFAVVNGALPPGMHLHDDGVVNGTPTTAGEFTVTVSATDSNNTTTTRTITKRVAATAPSPDIQIQKKGSQPVAGWDEFYVIMVRNTGSTVARNVTVDEYLEPWFTFTSAGPQPYSTDTKVTFDGVHSGYDSNLSSTVVTWNVSRLRPGEITLLTYQAKVDVNAPNGFQVSGKACVDNGTCYDTFKRCQRKVTKGCSYPGALAGASSIATYAQCAADPLDCLYSLFGPSPKDTCKQLGNETICKRQYKTCRFLQERPMTTPVCDKDTNGVRHPNDPNEKFVAAERYVQPGATLPYAVHFKNVGNATARNVTVTDRLPAELNLSTVRAVSPNRTSTSLAAGQTVTLYEQNKTRSQIVTVDNATVIRNETVTENHTVALSGGTARWTLDNLDLDPNDSGTVLLTAQTDPNLSTGTRIENDATIQFDSEQPITTDETVNVIDDVPPSCTVKPLPGTSSTTIPLEWTGQDSVGRIDDVALFVSTDGETWTVAESGLTANNTTYTGEVGQTYRFMCVATDTAGNRETQVATVEATTTVTTDESNDGTGSGGAGDGGQLQYAPPTETPTETPPTETPPTETPPTETRTTVATPTGTSATRASPDVSRTRASTETADTASRHTTSAIGETTTSRSPGFGVVLAIAGLLVAALLARRSSP